ncbi:uncharacterized protein LOC134228871 [Saccostrea cucullata]|uniref:uncharacterized protein LOC134228871 n=1 Tax=Saccostrea cuccullata TaxID=36930 RepID=UPI002ED3220A
MNKGFTFLIVLAYAGLITDSYADVCVDKIPDCAEYTLDSCKPQYVTWAYENCPDFCGFCRKQCLNKRSDCHEFGKTMCQPPYETWAKRNCAEYCGYCGAESKCLYSPWITLTRCSKSCGTGFTTQIRTQHHVPSGTPLAKDCTEALFRNKSCNTNSCKVPETVLNPDLVTVKNPVPVTEKTPVFVPDPVIDHGPLIPNVDPVDVGAAVGTAGAIGVIGALLTEILPVLPLFAFGKRSTTEEAAAFQNLIKEILIINAKNNDKFI